MPQSLPLPEARLLFLQGHGAAPRVQVCALHHDRAYLSRLRQGVWRGRGIERLNGGIWRRGRNDGGLRHQWHRLHRDRVSAVAPEAVPEHRKGSGSEPKPEAHGAFRRHLTSQRC
jgi:hypothetical protein